MCKLTDDVNSTMADFLVELTDFLFAYAEKNFAVVKIFFKVVLNTNGEVALSESSDSSS